MSDGRLPVRRRWIGTTVGVLAVALLLAIGWLVVRGLGAANDLSQVAANASALKAAIAKGELDRADTLSHRIADHAASARGLTSDPVWRAFEVVPWLGPNLTAVREVSEIADDVSEDALGPVVSVLGDVDLSALGLSGGAIDLAPFTQVEAPLGRASAALADASARAARIDAEATLPALADAVRELRGTMDDATTVVGALHGAAQLLPSMLGGSGPRTYVVAMQNNAELRSSGGIVGALAVVRAEGGRIGLVGQASAADFRALASSLPLSEPVVALFEDRPGRFIQNATSIPDFREAGPVIAEMWTQRFGGPVDGVLAVDAVVAAHLLEATGPVQAGPVTLDAESARELLLSGIYQSVPDPAAQDQVFAQVAGSLFSAALGAPPRALISALADAADEHRIRIWSAHPEEEEILAASTLGGGVPADGTDTATVGILLNDMTGAKMDFYAKAQVAVSYGVCDGRPTTRVSTTWTNAAPADAAETLPPYVTAGGAFGVPPGSTETLVAVYGPQGALPARYDRDGETGSVQTATLERRPVIQHSVRLAPGESTTITVDFTGEGAGRRLTDVRHTPMAGPIDTSVKPIVCDR